MDKKQAQKIIKDTFESPFDKNRFTVFIKNLLNKIEVSTFIYKGNFIPYAYRPYIKTLERIGKFFDGENEIDILIVTLKKDVSLERARTMQRNFIAWYLNGSRGGKLKDGALVAFVSPEQEDWRFSFIKMDYIFEQNKSGQTKVKQDFTPARRWSFLVGSNEKSHTAQSRFIDILTNDKQSPTLKEIEEAFNIETVTKEFFREYRNLFLRTKEELDKVVTNNPRVKADFEVKNVDTVNFAKKLLGQIVFLYFLQKKGWFGVPKDKDWGNGSKQFLIELFMKKYGDYNNFFNDILEPLFYDALRNDRSHDDHYYSRFDCKIPFLNGGLFDPIGNYDWINTEINLPDELFYNNNKTKEGDIGDGILNVFERFNFTVKEDEPLEREVAIDPELLGKAYEKFNAIRPDNFDEYMKVLKSGNTGEENKFNKKFGVYYTPREIVHYMCKQSLIYYLTCELDGKVEKEAIEAFVNIGENVSEYDAAALIKEELVNKGAQKSTKFKPALLRSIRDNAELIDQKLSDITVCDPAVGSGAFPVGMMNEIVKARNVLSNFLQDKDRHPYNFKRRCIEHSLYGVDIDPGAVEIAKLRLWLSLVVDEDDIKNIKPLPNLDFRIMQGDSLVSEFLGIDFDLGTEIKKSNMLFKDEVDQLIENFQQTKNRYLNESSVSRKSELRDEVHNLMIKIINSNLNIKKSNYERRLKNVEIKYSGIHNEKQRNELVKNERDIIKEKYGSKIEEAEKSIKEFVSGRQVIPFFLWKLYFSEVFHNKGGFDVVIGNPPYLNVELVSKEQKKYFARKYKTFYKRYDVFGLFFELSLESLVNNRGCVTFIVPQQIFNNLSYKKLRDLMLNNRWLKEVLYLGDKIFEANNDVCILFLKKPCTDRIKLVNALDFKQPIITEVTADHFNKYGNVISFSHDSGGEAIINKIFSDKHERIKERYDVFQGIVTGNNEAFLPTEEQISKTRIEQDLLHPVLLGRDFEKWLIRNTKRRILYINAHTKLDKYPNTKRWLLDFKTQLEKRRECKRGIIPWYSLQWPRNKEQLDHVPKILVQGTRNPRLKTRIVATIDEIGVYGTQGLNFIVPRDNNADIYYLLAVLNSSIINYLYATKFLNVAIKAEYLKDTPIPKASDSNKKKAAGLVRKILDIRSENPLADITGLERELDKMVYRFYGLTPEEIMIVEGRSDNSN